MSACLNPAVMDLDHSDQLALRMMLSYIESECLRIGALDAARHAALAAALMPRGQAQPNPYPPEKRANVSVH